MGSAVLRLPDPPRIDDRGDAIAIMDILIADAEQDGAYPRHEALAAIRDALASETI